MTSIVPAMACLSRTGAGTREIADVHEAAVVSSDSLSQFLGIEYRSECSKGKGGV